MLVSYSSMKHVNPAWISSPFYIDYLASQYWEILSLCYCNQYPIQFWSICLLKSSTIHILRCLLLLVLLKYRNFFYPRKSAIWSICVTLNCSRPHNSDLSHFAPSPPHSLIANMHAAIVWWIYSSCTHSNSESRENASDKSPRRTRNVSSYKRDLSIETSENKKQCRECLSHSHTQTTDRIDGNIE